MAKMTAFKAWGGLVSWSLVAFGAALVVGGAFGSETPPQTPPPPPEMCVRGSWLKVPSRMRVFKLDEADDYEPETLNEIIQRENWGSNKLNDLGRLAKKVLYFAEAKQKNLEKSLDGRFSFRQFLDMNYYNLKTSCTVSKSEERRNFCAEIKTKAVSKRKGDNLVKNLSLYCQAMRVQLDTCCEIGLVRAAREELRQDLIKLKEILVQLATAVKGELKSEDFDEALKQYLNQKDKRLGQSLRDRCSRLLNKLEFVLANENREEKYGLKEEVALCRKVDSMPTSSESVKAQ